MFTGIIQALGAIASVEPRGGDTRLVIGTGGLDASDVAIGDSICVSGVCLTVVAIDAAAFAADVSTETLSCTTLGALKSGDCVNLEKSLRLADRLGGHLVSGHVDGVGRVLAVQPDARSQRWTFEVPPGLARYIAAKGSVCIDGVSLTVNEVASDRFGVNLIPYTLAHTGLGAARPGQRMNLEIDPIARYVARLLGTRPDVVEQTT